MAKDINKYAQNIARARYRTSGGTSSIPVSGRTGATIDPSLLKGKPAAGAPLASRPIEGGPALPANKAYNPIIDAESGEDPNAPRVETQQPIENRGVDPRYMIQGGGPRIDLSGFFPERANTSYDPNKAIGGENVPYKPAGFFRSFLGDPANRKNIESQQAQGAEWRADAKAEKERANKMTDRLAEIEALDKGPAARFAATEKRLADKEIQDEIERNNAIDLGLVREGNEAVLKDVDMVRREAADAAKQALEERRVALAEDAYKSPSYQAVNDPKGNVLFYNPKTGRPTGTFRQPNFGMITDPNDPTKQILGTTAGGYEGIGPSGSANEPQVTGFGDSYVNGLDSSGNKFGKLPPPPKPAAAVTPARSAATGELGEEVRGLIPSVGDYLGSGESPVSLSQDAPVTAQNREGFMAGLGDLTRGVSESARSIKPLMLGGRLPRYTPEQGGGVLGMMLNAPGAAMTPVEAGVNSVLRNTKNSYNSMFGDDSGASMSVPNKLQDPNALYMSDKEYKNYLRSKRSTE
jgi:hypothetical protein